MNGETILVVDDNKEIVYSISELLKYEGYQIVKAYDGMEALKALETNQIDLILLDVMMPKLNGLSALMKLRENYRIPVIILSAKTEESDKVSGLVLGADDYVEKPYNPAELIARVKAHLRRYHAWGGAAPKTDSDTLVNGGLVLDKKQRLILVEGEEVRLTATEYKILELLMGHLGQVLVSVMLAGCGIFVFYILIAYRTYYPTEKILYFGILGNILLGSGTAYLLEKGLNRKYQNWIPKGDAYYQEWRAEMKKMEHLLQVIGILAFAAAGIFFVLQSKFREYWSWYYNYAAGYVMLFTALIQYMVWQFVRRRFDEKRREMLMGKLEEINQKRIAEALESEKKSLAKVSRSDQLRIDLITNVSHDLKTPLTSMVGYIELIKKEELSDLVRDYVDVLSERAEKLKEMINSLFSLAKASSGNIELHPEKFELNRLVEQIFADMHDHVKESELQFVKQFTEENTEIISDNMYFYRICQNLIENALKYSAKHTRVFVKTYQKESSNHLCLEITNTAGYPMDFTKEEIIERFFRGDKQRSSEGNGLGLAIVSTYVKALGGEFDIKIDCDQFKACVEMPLSAITIT